ncbi:MAG: hypothetical protein QNJ15_04580 [Erythrobacter sp.]|nr:hypothetical protein [Erythrobacter sp.]
MIDSIIRDVLRDAPNIEIISSENPGIISDYDVLVLNSLDSEPEGNGYSSPSPSSGIVMVNSGGRTATVFRKLSEDLNLEISAPIALERAILMAAEQG